MADSFFERQIASYASCHRDPRNRMTHFFGIPIIVFSLLLPLALWRFELAGYAVSGALLVAALAWAGWIALDLTIGLAMGAMLIPMWLAAEWIARSTGATATWIAFAALFVGGWVLQLWGHVFEGRRPALVDNLFQAFIGPMFIVAEWLMMAGFKRELQAKLDAVAPAATTR
jgi:uncharacterized membrane protein YGL010W